ncbi:zinc finger SWIM domain protein [Chthoniobacter flavus Ellin428]|uniref:Zinc finger SWIM domain protein n=1 Tax=Chthoniobacter flavus Ellin428 TaxID=497964 RepID=B4D494_9BACT|nr:hypothetical protein [Chthoniobacter flavus]EDY18695.1 zinc finger SWIM domain protein [Chthoniobacter flavus Ellin428]TCO89066.1 hypothetical protein EV701_115101 [Chthoniobacter flavus]
MNLSFAYLGRSALTDGSLSFSPNLSREPVAFDAALRHTLRFREAISALHDVVISDHRYKKRDKSAYEAWKASEAARVRNVRSEALKQAKADVYAKSRVPLPPDFERQHHRLLNQYWDARRKYADHLRQTDMELWRLLMPCDPVVTVANDVVFFECFSADESSYGCLTVNRDDGFGPSEQLQLGTTNVDYSWDLYHEFQALRSYRETRFRVDPQGFDVATHGRMEYREEKIDLPDGWLRGFMQLQSAMTLPMRRVTLTREALYSVMVWLKRHRARTSPRALRFERHGGGLTLVLEPWETRIPVYGATAEADWAEPVRIWGRQRLLALARLLPMIESVDVYLLGTGFPSFWVARMGEMRLTLGLSGWTANDWTHGSALDMLAPPAPASAVQIETVAQHMRTVRAQSFNDIVRAVNHPPSFVASALKHLAHTGQLIADLDAGLYRWRQIMPRVLGEAELGPENPEFAAMHDLLVRKRAIVESTVAAPSGGFIFTGKVESKPVEVLVDTDGRIKRGRCLCGHHQRAGIRMGPCRHLLALRWLALNQTPSTGGNDEWFARLRAQAGEKGGA